MQCEPDLFRRALTGDNVALGEVLQKASHDVRGHLSAQMPRRWQAVLAIDDVMQVTYLEAFLRIRQFHGDNQAAFVVWLQRTADNNLRDAIRGLECGKRPPPAVQEGR